jgi:hypothetical protein
VKGHIEKRGQRWWVSLELDPTIDPDTGARIRRRRGGGTYRTRREAEETLRDALDASRRGWHWPGPRDCRRLPRRGMVARCRAEAGTDNRRAISHLDDHLRDSASRGRAIRAAHGEGHHRPVSRSPPRRQPQRWSSPTEDGARGQHNAAACVGGCDAGRTHRVEPGGRGDRAQGDSNERAEGVGCRRTPPIPRSRVRRPPRCSLAARGIDGHAARRAAGTPLDRCRSGRGPSPHPGDAGLLRKAPSHEGAQDRAVAEIDPDVRSVRRSDEGVAAVAGGGATCGGSGIQRSGDRLQRRTRGVLSPSATSAAFRRTVKAAGLPPITLHGLRHTFATLGLEAGVDVLYVSELLGHSTPAITQAVYQHVRPGRLEAAIDTISAAIDG